MLKLIRLTSVVTMCVVMATAGVWAGKGGGGKGGGGGHSGGSHAGGSHGGGGRSSGFSGGGRSSGGGHSSGFSGGRSSSGGGSMFKGGHSSGGHSSGGSSFSAPRSSGSNRSTGGISSHGSSSGLRSGSSLGNSSGPRMSNSGGLSSHGSGHASGSSGKSGSPGGRGLSGATGNSGSHGTDLRSSHGGKSGIAGASDSTFRQSNRNLDLGQRQIGKPDKVARSNGERPSGGTLGGDGRIGRNGGGPANDQKVRSIRDGHDPVQTARHDGDRVGRGGDSGFVNTGRGGDGWRDGKGGRGDWDGGRGNWNGNNNNGWNGHYHHHHNNWHRGFWRIGLLGINPWWGGWGPGWGGYGYGFGLGLGYSRWGFAGYGWGLNSWGYPPLSYNSGYYGYYNPYCTAPLVLGTTVVDYSQPIVVAQANPAPITDEAVDDPATAAAMAEFDAARAAFRNGDYGAALIGVDRAVQQIPDDAVLHEFRALVLFAQGDYQQAAATLNSVLAGGPGWDWETLRALYPDVSTYTTQLRALEAFARSHPTEAYPRFLLAYHYLTCGYSDTAVEQLKRVVALQPNDTLSRQMLKSLSPDTPLPAPTPEAAGGPGLTGVPPVPPVAVDNTLVPPAPPVGEQHAVAKPIVAESLVGSWNATREDGSTFGLTLDNEGNFAWRFSVNGQTNDLKGKYTLANDLLILEPDDGGAMVGRLSESTDGQFHFQLVGSPADDPGLTFKK